MIVNKAKKQQDIIANNFRNRYLEEAELQKPSSQVAVKSIRTAREKIDEILGIKKEAAFGTNIQKLGNTTTEMVKFTAKG